MKYFWLYLIPVLVAVLPGKSYAQDDQAELPARDVTIRESNSFTVPYSDSSGNLPVTLTATYSSLTREYRIFWNQETTDSIRLNDPLNINTFRVKITKLFNDKDQSGKTYSEFAINEIFLWLYTLKIEEGDLTIGKLFFKRWALVFEGDTSNHFKNAKEREFFLDTVSKNYEPLEVARSASRNEFRTAFNTARQTIKDQKDSTRKDTALIDQITQKINSSQYNANLLSADVIDLNSRHQGLLNESAIKYRFEKFDTSNIKATQKRLSLIAQRVYPVKKISIQFERGHIERIQVWVGNRAGGNDIYENIYAVGFSSINNLKAFQATKLFIRKSAQSYNDFIYLSDVIGNYDNLLDLYTRDYSPGDTVINNIDPSKNPYISLRKERNIRLFDSKIYSDLAGLSDEAPNGLVQVEVSRKFNLNTYRWQIGSSRLDWNIFSYLNLYGALSKIENKQKDLPLRNTNTIVNNKLVSPSYATNLDLRRYENASLGMDINLFLFDYPDMKFTAYVDGGARYGHTRIADTVRNVVNGIIEPSDSIARRSGHTATFYPKISLEFFSERRVGLVLGYQYNYTILFSNNHFKQIMSDAKSDLNSLANERLAHKSHMLEVLLRAETSQAGNGQLFLRSRFFWQQGDANTFFSQIQVGYAYSIIYKK
jgi:hypothetical protein